MAIKFVAKAIAQSITSRKIFDLTDMIKLQTEAGKNEVTSLMYHLKKRMN